MRGLMVSAKYCAHLFMQKMSKPLLYIWLEQNRALFDGVCQRAFRRSCILEDKFHHPVKKICLRVDRKKIGHVLCAIRGVDFWVQMRAKSVSWRIFIRISNYGVTVKNHLWPDVFLRSCSLCDFLSHLCHCKWAKSFIFLQL